MDTPLSGVQQRMLQRSELGWGRGGSGEIFLLELGGTLVSDISLAPSEWTSGARIKAAQYCSCQRKGLTWHPLLGCPENDLRPEVCSPEVATHWKCLVTHTVMQRQMATPLVLSWGSLSTPLSLCWGPLNLGTPLCCRAFLTQLQGDSRVERQGALIELLQHACHSASHFSRVLALPLFCGGRNRLQY